MINRNLVRSNPHKPLKPLSSGFLPDLLPHSVPLHLLRADFSLQARQTPAKNGRYARQIVGRESKHRLRSDLRKSYESRLAQTTYGLAPSKNLFDQFTFLQTNLVTSMARRASIDGTGFLLRDMRRNA